VIVFWCIVIDIKGIEMLQKFVNIETKKNGKASFIASTSTSDRYGDVIDQASWNLEGYKKNPVILLNHRQDMLPIGRASNVSVVNGQLEIDVEFDMNDELGASVARKVEEGFLTAVSVGFQPTKAAMRSELPKDHKAFGKSGMYYEDAELLEVSVVTIPANSEAVAKNHKGMIPNLERLIRQIVKAELLSRPAVELENVKHILQVEEEADRYIVHFAKPEMMEEAEVEEEDVEEMASELLEELESGMKDDEEEKRQDDDDDEEDLEEMKHLIKYLLS
jgi:HK97 family phage prohead protease